MRTTSTKFVGARVCVAVGHEEGKSKEKCMPTGRSPEELLFVWNLRLLSLSTHFHVSDTLQLKSGTELTWLYWTKSYGWCQHVQMFRVGLGLRPLTLRDDDICTCIFLGCYTWKSTIHLRKFHPRTKCTLYSTLIRPVVLYGHETWIMLKEDMRALGVFEWRVLRTIYGGVHEQGEWRRRMNHELA